MSLPLLWFERPAPAPPPPPPPYDPCGYCVPGLLSELCYLIAKEEREEREEREALTRKSA